MKHILVFFTVFHGFLSASIINDLKMPQDHQTSGLNGISTVFVIRSYEYEDLSSLYSECTKFGIQPNEFHNFMKLSKELLAKYCSSIVSPYLLSQILSHLSIYKYCLDHNLNNVLIMESQACLYENPSTLSSILYLLQSRCRNWDILYCDTDFHDATSGKPIAPRLSNLINNKKRIHPLFSKVFCRYGTLAYIISQNGMKKILKYFQNHWSNLPYDQILFKIPGLNVFSSNRNIISNRLIIGEQKTRERTTESAIERNYEFITGKEFWMNPLDLLCRDRFDIMAKYIYARYYLGSYQTQWHQRLYQSHLEKWTQCYNTDPLKIGYQDFETAFQKVIQNLQRNAFDENFTIHVNNAGHAWDGAHRIGTGIALQLPVKVKIYDGYAKADMSPSKFKNQYKLEEHFIDHMVYEYAKLKENTFIVTLFPIAYEYQSQLEEVLEENGVVIYSKDLWLYENGPMEFIRIVYNGEWWTGSYIDKYKHSFAKANKCFPRGLIRQFPVRVYLFECENKAVARKIKESFREKIQNHDALHINDTHDQTVIIAASLFNKNTIDFINTKRMNIFKNFDDGIDKLKEFFKNHHLDPDDFCVDTGSVLSAYGLRDCKDIDVLHHNPLPPNYKEYGIDSHNPHLHHHHMCLDEIIYNPENHFYYNGIKFVNLSLVKDMKKDRGSEKDLRDIELIRQLE